MGRWCLSPAPARFSHFLSLNDFPPASRSLEQATCMYTFLHCLSSQKYVVKSELSMWINVFWWLNQISVDNIWRTSFHIYKTIHKNNITLSCIMKVSIFNLFLWAGVERTRSRLILWLTCTFYCPRRDFGQKAKSRGGTLVTRGY